MIAKVKKYLAAKRFQRGNPVVNDECMEFEVNKWVLSQFIITRLVPVVGIHPFPLDELLLLTGAVAKIRPTHIFEWGTNIGKSARIFFETGRFFGIPTEIHSIDLPDDIVHAEHPGGQRGMLVKGIREVTLHAGDGLDTALGLCRSRGGDKFVPLFFLDGDHSYESVKRELSGILSGIESAHIIVHDTFNQSEGSGYNTGPYRAVQEILPSISGEHQVIAETLGLPGMTLIWHRSRNVK